METFSAYMVTSFAILTFFATLGRACHAFFHVCQHISVLMMITKKFTTQFFHYGYEIEMHTLKKDGTVFLRTKNSQSFITMDIN